MIITEYHNPTLVQIVQVGDLLRIIVDTPNEGLSETKFRIQREAFDDVEELELGEPGEESEAPEWEYFREKYEDGTYTGWEWAAHRTDPSIWVHSPTRADTWSLSYAQTREGVSGEKGEWSTESVYPAPELPEPVRGEYFVDASVYSNCAVAWTEDDNGDVWMYLSSYAEWVESSRTSLDECPAMNPGGGFTDTLPPGFPLPPWKDDA